MDAGTIVPSVVAGVSAAGMSAALLPMLFKGKLRHEREYKALEESSAKELRRVEEAAVRAIADRDALIDGLEDSLDKVNAELREQYRAVAVITTETNQTVKWLRDLPGIAARDQRRAD